MAERTPGAVVRDRSAEQVITRMGGRGEMEEMSEADETPEASALLSGGKGRINRPKGTNWRKSLRWGAPPVLSGARRIGQGVEITSREIRMVRLSCALDDGVNHFELHRHGEEHLPGEREISVDDAVCYPLEAGIVVGADIVDEAALSAALADCLMHQRMRLAALAEVADSVEDAADGEPAPADYAHTVALALCPSVVVQQEVWLEDLMPGFRMRLPRIVDEAAFDALEPWVRLHAQKISGIDPADIVVDWYRSAPFDADRVTVAAAQRHYLDVRERMAVAAGISLSALGDAAAAALGACRFVVARCLHAPMAREQATGLYPAPVEGPRFSSHASGVHTEARASLERMSHHVASQRFAALWIGESAWRAWTFDAGGATLEGVALPQTGDAKAVVAKLRASAPGPLGLVLVAGERQWLDVAGGLRGIGEALGCPAIEFDASSCCVGPAATPQQLGPGLAVAFGLALRELQT